MKYIVLILSFFLLGSSSFPDNLSDELYDKIVQTYFESITDETPVEEMIQFIVQMKVHIELSEEHAPSLCKIFRELEETLKVMHIKLSKEEFQKVYGVCLKYDLIHGKKWRAISKTGNKKR